MLNRTFLFYIDALLDEMRQEAGLTAEELEAYMEVPFPDAPFESACCSLADGNQQYSVKIKRFYGKIRTLLSGYDPEQTARDFAEPGSLYAAFVENDIGQTNEYGAPYSQKSWQAYAQGIQDAARLFSGEGAHTLDTLLRANPQTPQELEALFPQIDSLHKGIKKMGFALACNFLKDCGCTYLVKPDLHIKEFWLHTHLWREGYDRQIALIAHDMADIRLQKTVVLDTFAQAQALGISPYRFDRMLYLITSGRFFDHGKKVPGRGEALFARLHENEANYAIL